MPRRFPKFNQARLPKNEARGVFMALSGMFRDLVVDNVWQEGEFSLHVGPFKFTVEARPEIDRAKMTVAHEDVGERYLDDGSQDPDWAGEFLIGKALKGVPAEDFAVMAEIAMKRAAVLRARVDYLEGGN